MSFNRYFEKISFLDYLIRHKATGNQKEFARKANLSRSMLNEYLKEMKDLGFPISYCRKRNTYYYEQEGGLVKSLFESEIHAKEMRGYTGGFEYTEFFHFDDFRNFPITENYFQFSPIIRDSTI